jgi:hypothetical protein
MRRKLMARMTLSTSGETLEEGQKTTLVTARGNVSPLFGARREAPFFSAGSYTAVEESKVEEHDDIEASAVKVEHQDDEDDEEEEEVSTKKSVFAGSFLSLASEERKPDDF